MNKKKGFTLVELSLAIAFIASLSVIVTLVIVNSISAYRRGLTLNQINSVGMALVDDMREAVQESPARSIKAECEVLFGQDCNEGEVTKLIMMEKNVPINIRGSNSIVPAYGAFCTGKYSYIWNSGYYGNENEETKKIDITSNSKASLKYKMYGENDPKIKSDFGLLKAEDDERGVCRSAMNESFNGQFDISGMTINEEPKDLLEGVWNLAIYDLRATLPAESGNSNNMFYTVSFILGTIEGGINVTAAGDFCEPPGGQSSEVENFDYCAINKFNFAAQASGG